MNTLSATLHNLALVSKAERIINDFLDGDQNIIYVINPNGDTFKLQAGCTLLTAEGFQIKYEED